MFPFLFLYLVIVAWHQGRPTSQGWESPVLCLLEFLAGPEPLGVPGGSWHTKNSRDVAIIHNEWQNPWGTSSSLLFLHLPLACNHPPRKLCQPRRGGNSQERQQSLCLDFLHHLNFCAMKTSPAKNPSEGFYAGNHPPYADKRHFCYRSGIIMQLDPEWKVQTKKKLIISNHFPTPPRDGITRASPTHTLFKCIITSDYLNNANCHPQQGEILSRGIAEGQHVNDNNSLLSYQAGL